MQGTTSTLEQWKPHSSRLSNCYLLVHHPPSPLDLVIYGVGYHHAGLDMADRKTVEAVFINGELPVLCELALHSAAVGHSCHALCLTQHVMVHLLSSAKNLLCTFEHP